MFLCLAFTLPGRPPVNIICEYLLLSKSQQWTDCLFHGCMPVEPISALNTTQRGPCPQIKIAWAFALMVNPFHYVMQQLFGIILFAWPWQIEFLIMTSLMQRSFDKDLRLRAPQWWNWCLQTYFWHGPQTLGHGKLGHLAKKPWEKTDGHIVIPMGRKSFEVFQASSVQRKQLDWWNLGFHRGGLRLQLSVSIGDGECRRRCSTCSMSSVEFGFLFDDFGQMVNEQRLFITQSWGQTHSFQTATHREIISGHYRGNTMRSAAACFREAKHRPNQTWSNLPCV